MLRECQKVKLEKYKGDRKTQDIVEREFERAILACVDIAARIISARNFPPASSYAEVFDILHAKGILSGELTEEMKALVRFRNVLVHQYFRIDPVIVYQKLQNKLNNFVTFSQYVETYL